jgi:hypothetical protein
MEARRVQFLSIVVLLASAPLAHAQSPVLSQDQTAIACAPALSPSLVATRQERKARTEEPAENPLRILGGQDTLPHMIFGPRDLVVVSGGVNAGVKIGQEYFIRRPFRFGMYSTERPRTVLTAGWLRIVALNDATAIAIVDSACDTIGAGDYLEPFEAPPAPAAAVAGSDTPANLDFSSLGRVLFGREERRIGGAGDFMIIERRDGQMAPGTRVAVYRDLRVPGVPLTAVGEGVVVSAANGAPVMEITAAKDAIESGDYVVPHKR